MTIQPVHVFIMCQGDQKRLRGAIDCPKQLLRLEHRSESKGLREFTSIAILDRTLEMVVKMLAPPPEGRWADHRITIVGGDRFGIHFELGITKIQTDGTLSYVQFVTSSGVGGIVQTGLLTLREPGNSSNKGIVQALSWATTNPLAMIGYPPRAVVLLGDVVYSWDALASLFAPLPEGGHDIRFTGTPDLSPSEGEIFGIALGYDWHTGHDSALDHLKAANGGLIRPGGGVAIDSPIFHSTAIGDYTDDIDVPEDLKNLPELATSAHMDDRKHGLSW